MPKEYDVPVFPGSSDEAIYTSISERIPRAYENVEKALRGLRKGELKVCEEHLLRLEAQLSHDLHRPKVRI